MRRRLGVAGLSLVLSACDLPDVTQLAFDLTTPNSDDGAIQFTMTAMPGREILGLEAACTGCSLFTRMVDERQAVGIVTGLIVEGELLRATVSHGGPDVFAIAVVEVASRSYALRSTEGYRLSRAR